MVGALTSTDRATHDVLWVNVYPGLTLPMFDYMIESFEAFGRERH